MGKLDINFLRRGVTPAGQVVIAPGGTSNIFIREGGLSNVGIFPGRLFLKRIEATCTVAGAAASATAFTLIGDPGGTTRAIFAVGISAVGTRIVFDFPVPEISTTTFDMTLSAAAIGTWAFVCNGFIL